MSKTFSLLPLLVVYRVDLRPYHKGQSDRLDWIDIATAVVEWAHRDPCRDARLRQWLDYSEPRGLDSYWRLTTSELARELEPTLYTDKMVVDLIKHIGGTND